MSSIVIDVSVCKWRLIARSYILVRDAKKKMGKITDVEVSTGLKILVSLCYQLEWTSAVFFVFVFTWVSYL